MKMLQIQKYFGMALLIILMASAGGCARTPLQKRDRFLEAGKKLYDKKEYQRAILEFKNAAAVVSWAAPTLATTNCSRRLTVSGRRLI
jgi:hypothetical protein